MRKFLIGIAVAALLALPAMAYTNEVTETVTLEVQEFLKLQLWTPPPTLVVAPGESGTEGSFQVRAACNTEYDLIGKIEGNASVVVGYDEYNGRDVTAADLAWAIAGHFFYGEEWSTNSPHQYDGEIGSLDDDGSGNYVQEGLGILYDDQPANEPYHCIHDIYIGVCTWTWKRYSGDESLFPGYIQAGTYDNAATITLSVVKEF